LAVSRAFGDRNLKSLLRSEPDIKVENIDHTAELLVLASDGLWKLWLFFLLLNLPRWPISDWKFGTTLLRFLQFSLIDQVMNNREVVDVAKRFKDPYAAAKQLTAEALKRDSKDDISCIVVRFKA